jgi:hypothetical protein
MDSLRLKIYFSLLFSLHIIMTNNQTLNSISELRKIFNSPFAMHYSADMQYPQIFNNIEKEEDQ